MASKRLSYATIKDLWIKAGGDPKKADVMAAIAIAESGGRPTALNSTPPDYSVGLWQINYYGALRPGRTREFGSPSALMASPTAQARAAVAIERQQGLSAWSTYSSGAYRQHLNGADYSGGGTDTGGGSSSATDAGLLGPDSKPANCLIGFNTGLGYGCVLTTGQGRAILGGLLLAGGTLVTGVGLIILASYGLKRSGALEQAAAAAAVVPLGGGVAGAFSGAATAVKRTPQQAAAKRTARKQARAAKKKEKEEPEGSEES